LVPKSNPHHPGTYVLSSGYYDAFYLRPKSSHADPQDFLKALKKWMPFVNSDHAHRGVQVGEKSD